MDFTSLYKIMDNVLYCLKKSPILKPNEKQLKHHDNNKKPPRQQEGFLIQHRHHFCKINLHESLMFPVDSLQIYIPVDTAVPSSLRPSQTACFRPAD